MKLKIFCIYDSKVEAFNQPFFLRSAGEALRGLIELAQDPKTNFNKYPADYTLFEIGEYDDTDASLSMLDAKISHGTALEAQALGGKQ